MAQRLCPELDRGFNWPIFTAVIVCLGLWCVFVWGVIVAFHDFGRKLGDLL